MAQVGVPQASGDPVERLLDPARGAVDLPAVLDDVDVTEGLGEVGGQSTTGSAEQWWAVLGEGAHHERAAGKRRLAEAAP